MFIINDIGSDELAVGYGEASEFAESVAEVSNGECTLVRAFLCIDDVHGYIAPVLTIENIEIVTDKSDITVCRLRSVERCPARSVVLIGRVDPFGFQ